MGSERGESKPRGKMVTVEDWAGEGGSLAERQGSPRQRGMLDVKDSLLIPSPRKSGSLAKRNECTQNLCPDAYIRDI